MSSTPDDGAGRVLPLIGPAQRIDRCLLILTGGPCRDLGPAGWFLADICANRMVSLLYLGVFGSVHIILSKTLEHVGSFTTTIDFTHRSTTILATQSLCICCSNGIVASSYSAYLLTLFIFGDDPCERARKQS